jgi:hypothetical protein
VYTSQQRASHNCYICQRQGVKVLQLGKDEIRRNKNIKQKVAISQSTNFKVHLIDINEIGVCPTYDININYVHFLY